MVEPGASDGQPELNLTNVSIADTASTALENRGGIVVAQNLNISGCEVNAIHSLSKEGSVTVNGGNIGTTQVESVKADKGSIRLNNVTLEGSDTNTLLASGGDLVLNTVEVKKAGAAALSVTNADSQVTGDGITLGGCAQAISGTAGTVEVSNLNANATQRNIAADGVAVTVNSGTLGETWEGSVSLNHHMYGSVSDFFYQSVAGIRIDDAAPGFAHVILCPHVPEGMNYFCGEHQSPKGTVSVEYDHGKLTVTLPKGVTATLSYGDVKRELSGGVTVI
jgi:alpha-L-rhamnosidase